MNLLLLACLAAVQVPERDPEEVRRALRTILERPEFKEKMPDEFWARMRELLKLAGETPRPTPPPARASTTDWGWLLELLKWTAIVLGVGIALALIVYFLYTLATRRAAPAPPKQAAAGAGEAAPSAAANALDQTSDAWAADAEGLFRKGKVAEAIRALYLSVLSHSHRRSWIDYSPGLTNWHYVRVFSGPPAGRAPLRTLTLLFESKWYGRKPASEEDYHASRSLAGTILQTEEPAGP